MVVDCHTHLWQTRSQLGSYLLGEAGRPGEPAPDATGQPSAPGVDVGIAHSLVLGCRVARLGAHISAEWISDAVAAGGGRLIGLAGVDPSAEDPREAVETAVRLGLAGVVLDLSAQRLHPTDSRVELLVEAATREGKLVVFHQGSPFQQGSLLEAAMPLAYDPLLSLFPGGHFLFCQAGGPWQYRDMLALLARHPSAYAELSGLWLRPHSLFGALSSAVETGVDGQLLFGSDSPFASARECMVAALGVNQMLQDTFLPMVPQSAVRSILERDALSALGIPLPGSSATRPGGEA